MCQSEVSDYQAYIDQNGLPDNVDLYSISTGVDSTADNYPPSTWLSDLGWQLPVMRDDRDSTALKSMGLTHFPYTVFVGSDGLILGRVTGAIPVQDLFSFLTQME